MFVHLKKSEDRSCSRSLFGHRCAAQCAIAIVIATMHTMSVMHSLARAPLKKDNCNVMEARHSGLLFAAGGDIWVEFTFDCMCNINTAAAEIVHSLANHWDG